MERQGRQTSTRDEMQSPPGVIRGQNSQDAKRARDGLGPETPGIVGVHWLRGSVPMDELARLAAYVDTWFGDERQEREYGLWFYDRSILWPDGVTLNYHSHSDRAAITNGRITLEIPGGALDHYDTWMVLSFMRGLGDFSFQASRLDVYYDDAERTITPTKLFATVYGENEEGETILRDFTGFRRITRRLIANQKGRASDEVMFGARGDNGSGKYLRCYDKRLETNGENPSVRWELELSDERSQKAFDLLTHGDAEQAATCVGALVGGCIDFKKRTHDRNASRWQRHEFWQTILGRLGAVKLATKTPVKSVDKAQKHICTQAAGNLQLLREAWGAERFFPWLVDIVDSTNRLRSQHYVALDAYRRDLEAAGDKTLCIEHVRDYCDDNEILLEGDDDEPNGELS